MCFTVILTPSGCLEVRLFSTFLTLSKRRTYRSQPV
uniref:Uncharacterized protein n=1 Tax=Anguilla anguilla TaxID=7936 RepID=A0A0E9SX26_ANGAN